MNSSIGKERPLEIMKWWKLVHSVRNAPYEAASISALVATFTVWTKFCLCGLKGIFEIRDFP